MESEHQTANQPQPPANAKPVGPDFERPVILISDILTRPDFPKSALGEHVDIGGYTGVVVDVVRQSLKVRSQEGVTMSFNANGLRRIYGPVSHPDPYPEPVSKPPEPGPSPAPPAEIVRPPQLEPDFTKPVKKIETLVRLTGYPEFLLGEHIAIGDYAGVVVQIVNRSLKVRSPAESTRSYNADALKKLYGA